MPHGAAIDLNAFSTAMLYKLGQDEADKFNAPLHPDAAAENPVAGIIEFCRKPVRKDGTSAKYSGHEHPWMLELGIIHQFSRPGAECARSRNLLEWNAAAGSKLGHCLGAAAWMFFMYSSRLWVGPKTWAMMKR